MGKKAIAIFICILLVITLLPGIGIQNITQAAAVSIYKVDWSKFQEGDKISDPKEGLARSGGADITVTGSPAKSFYISGRKDNWDALDIQNDFLKLDRDATYEITVTGHVDSGVDTKNASVKLGGVTRKTGEGDGYPEFKKEKLQAGKSFTLTYELKISQQIPDSARNLWVLRVQTDEASGGKAGDLVPYYVDDIVITQTEAGKPAAPVTLNGESRTLYELDADKNLIIGEELSSPALKVSGSAKVAVVRGDDGTASLQLKDRVNNYDAVDILFSEISKGSDNTFITGTYTINVTGHVEAEDAGKAQFLIGMTESPYGELTSRITPASDGSFELNYTKSFAKASEVSTLGYNYRIQTPPSVFTTFYVDNITVTVKGAEETGIGVRKLHAFPFDNQKEQGGLFTVAASSKIEWVEAPGIGKEDNSALKVTHIAGKSYTGADNAVRLTFAEPLPAGGVYKISAWFYAPAEENKGKGTLTGPGIVLNADYAGSTGVSKFPSDFGTLPLDEWKEVNVTLPVRDTPLTSIDFRLVVNEADKHPDVWRLDNIVISQEGETEEIVVPEWDLTLASLKEAYADYFMIGNIMEPGQIQNAETTAMFKEYYNVVTAENAMKPANMTSAKGQYRFDQADTLVAWAEDNNLKVHGHTLVWHSQSAPWLTAQADGTPLTRAEAKANMEDYINAVAGHYAGQVISWDVVNEAFLPGVSVVPTDWRNALRKYEENGNGSPWYQAYENGADKSKGEDGSDYIYDAFVFTRLADPGAVLYYNDFNETEAGKREAIALMVEELNKKWKTDKRNTEPDRLLIEGIGMQAHYWTGDLKASDVEACIKRFIKTGAKISVSELDIPMGDYMTYKQRVAAPTAEEEKQQADLYGQLFEVYKKYADSIERVTFWGKADTQSWRFEGYPLLFDKNFAPKEAYFAVMSVAEDKDIEPVAVNEIPKTGEDNGRQMIWAAAAILTVSAMILTKRRGKNRTNT